MPELFWMFVKCSALTFGGGYSMVSVFEYEIVTRHALLAADAFANLVGLAQITPGPIGFNSATYVGFAHGGWLGAFVASLAVMVPSFTITLAVAAFLERVKGSKGLKVVMKIVRPYVFVIVALAAWFFIRTALCWQGGVIFAAVIALRLVRPKWNPIWSLLLSAILGLLL